LTISTINVVKAGGGSGSFAVTGGSCALGGNVGAGGNCTVRVTLSEPAAGALGNSTATLTVTGVKSNTTTPVYTATDPNLSGS
jgi:hypothetical protein